MDLYKLIYDALPARQSLTIGELARLLADELAKTDLLIVNRQVLRVDDYDWRDANDDGETWEVYTEARNLNDDDDDDETCGARIGDLSCNLPAGHPGEFHSTSNRESR